MSGRLKGKRAFVTAASAGIGRACAIAFAREGAHVYASDINESAFDDLKKAGVAETFKLDVLSTEAVNEAAKRIGTIDILLNAAGFVHHGTVLECSDKDWDFSFDLNVKSMFHTCRALLPGMLDRATETGTASILNMASMASSIKGFPNRAAYGATKAAVIGLTKAIAADFVKQGLRCNALCPGTVDTPSLRGRINAAADPVQAEKDFIARQPMGRLATTDDITPMVVFLLSDESRFVSGQACLVDGGVTI